MSEVTKRAHAYTRIQEKKMKKENGHRLHIAMDIAYEI